MSKKLTKILTISILAVIIPVAIIVTAICLSNAVTYTLTLAVEGLENVGNISLKVNGTEYTQPVKISRNSNVRVSIETIGYDFKGWYEGTTADITAETQALSTETTYTFKMEEDKTFTAMNDIIKYQVSYNGAEAVEVKYGAELADHEDEDRLNGDVFAGWQIAGDDAIYTVAIFDEANIALTSVQKNLYTETESYKQINFSCSTDEGPWYSTDGDELLTTVNVNNSVKADLDELSFDIDSKTVADLLDDFAIAYDAQGGVHSLESVTIVAGTLQKLNLGLNLTVREFIEKYNNLVGNDNKFADGETINIRLAFAD